MDDLICDFNYIAENDQLINEKPIDTPLFYTKQLIKEMCIYPLGCSLVKQSGRLPVNSVLFAGPSGTGKTHAALAVAYHTDALFFDFSPANMARFSTKPEYTSIFAKSFRVARKYQPAVFYFDFAEQIFNNPKVKGAVKNSVASKMKKMYINYKNLVTENMRILFIGNTSKGFHGNIKDFKSMFDRTLIFSLPSFSDNYKIWKKEIYNRIGRHYDLEYDVLAHMSRGFSPESVIYNLFRLLLLLNIL